MAFTTWAALKTQMLDDMASGSWKSASYSMAGQSRTYTTFENFKAALEYVEYRAGQEAGTTPGRTYARPLGSTS